MEKKRIYKRWTEEETRALLKLIEEHPDNFQEAIQIHANNTGRSTATIRTFFTGYRQKNSLPMGTINRWSVAEKKALLKLIESHPNNFSEAFRIHAENTGRTFMAVEKFFSNYRKKEDAKICMIALGKNKKCSPNRKNIHQKTGGEVTPVKVSIWKKILDLLGL